MRGNVNMFFFNFYKWVLFLRTVTPFLSRTGREQPSSDLSDLNHTSATICQMWSCSHRFPGSYRPCWSSFRLSCRWKLLLFTFRNHFSQKMNYILPRKRKYWRNVRVVKWNKSLQFTEFFFIMFSLRQMLEQTKKIYWGKVEMFLRFLIHITMLHN